MSKKDKLLEKFKRTPKNCTYREVVSLLEKHGFVVKERAGKGSHSKVHHPLHKDLRWTLSKDKPMSVFHIEEVVSLVEEVERREEE